MDAGKNEIQVIGGGMYGCTLAIHLAKKGHKVTLYEKDVDVLLGASNINQFKVHNGYHYPRDIFTAKACSKNYTKFIHDYPEAIHLDFIQYYAVAKDSRISSEIFSSTFEKSNLLDKCTKTFPHKLNNIEDVFRVDECSFNAHILRDVIKRQLTSSGVLVKTNTKVTSLEDLPGKIYICTYSDINALLKTPIELKYKRTELLYFRTPKNFRRVGLTIVDGNYFSFTPDPGRSCHVLSCVHLGVHTKDTNYLDIKNFVSEYLPLINDCDYLGNNFYTKALYIDPEQSDSRPVLIKKIDERTTAILGSKIDNIYDMLDEVDGACNNQYVVLS